MSLLLRWTWSRPLRTLAEHLEARPPGATPVGVVGSPALAQLLGARAPVVPYPAPAAGARLPATDGELAALVGVDPPDEAAVIDWARAVADGGQVLLVGRQAPEEHTRLCLGARLVDVEQRAHGRVVVTRGRVKRW